MYRPDNRGLTLLEDLTAWLGPTMSLSHPSGCKAPSLSTRKYG